jgi:hypothetical protein
VLAELSQLRALRLDRGWTYRRLEVEVNKVSPAKISRSSLHALLNDPKAVPNDLTLHGIRKFLASRGRARGRRQERAIA